MAFVSLKAWRTRAAERNALGVKLKQEIRAALALTAADALSVNEIACPDPGCPDMETIALVMRLGEPTRALRIRRPMDAVTASDIAELAAEEGRRRAAGEG